MSLFPKPHRHCYFRDNCLPDVGSLVTIYAGRSSILPDAIGIVEGIEETEDGPRIWLREGNDDCYRYDILFMEWELR